MVNAAIVGRLLSIPLGWLAAIQIAFGVLSVSLYQDLVARWFFVSGFSILALAVLLSWYTRKQALQKISSQESLVFAVVTWVIAGFSGAIPIQLIAEVSFTDAVFESISALTTTGATILVGLDDMPPSFLLYRQFLQWVGGLGVVIFVVAILPMLNVGGMRLLMAETPGPIKNDKLAPRIRQTARYLWLVYCIITVACAAVYWLAGMSAFDAIAHAFTTVSTGGFSTHDASMGYFDSNLLLWVSNLFMIIGAISFALHFKSFRSYLLMSYWRDEETRSMLSVMLAMSALLTLWLINNSHSNAWFDQLTQVTFHVISFMTSTGYGATDLNNWPMGATMVLVVLSFLGGCAGSTAGGSKMIRVIIMWRVIRQQLFVMIHPRAVKTVQYQQHSISDTIITAVMAFMMLALITTFIFTILLSATGLDYWSSFSAVSACINVLGPGFGEVSSNFIVVSDTGTWLLSLAMLLGRLEYFTLVALLLPSFWRG